MNSQKIFLMGGVDELKTKVKLLSIEIIGVLLCVTGLVLICTYTETETYEIVEDYTDCMNFNEPTTTCKDSLKINIKPCYCYKPINITQPINGLVTVFYELDSYDQSSDSYFNSRDPKQLLGELSLTPSGSCGAYTYVDTAEGKKPIAPCGEVADTMFNDTFSLQTNKKYVPFILTGVISEADKAPYHNPPGNLELAFKNFSKPKNWNLNVWELDTKNPDNNGFQNEAFIAWMTTEWKRKPAWRVNHTGLYEHGVPAGVYILRIEYAYPPTRYNGRRKVIINSMHHIIHTVKLGFGISLLLVGFILVVGKIIYNKKIYGKYVSTEQE